MRCQAETLDVVVCDGGGDNVTKHITLSRLSDQIRRQRAPPCGHNTSEHHYHLVKFHSHVQRNARVQGGRTAAAGQANYSIASKGAWCGFLGSPVIPGCS